MKLFAIFFITLLTVSIVSGSCTLSKAGRCAQDFGRNSHRAMGNKKLVCQAAREFQACIYELGECRGMSKNVVDRTIKKIIDSGCKLHSGTTIQKAQTISVIFPVLLLGHCLQLRIQSDVEQLKTIIAATEKYG